MNPVIGIVSYLPEDQRVRSHRYHKLCSLLDSCRQLFNLPVIIVAQNWPPSSVQAPWIDIHRYPDKLGIVGARRELRRLFLGSPYDYLIMLDDDCELQGGSGQKYLDQIWASPNCFLEFNKTLLKLFAISKTLFAEVDYDDISPENGEGFEDRVFVNKLRLQFPNCRREFKDTGLEVHSESTADPWSTWYTNQDLDQMLESTQKQIEKNKGILR